MKTLCMAISISSFLSACASYHNADQIRSQAQLPAMVLEQSRSSDRFDMEVAPMRMWWEEVGDDQLAKLIEGALVANYDIRIALANIDESRALLRRGKLERLPSITSEVSSTREQLSENISSSGDISQRHSAGFNLSWEVDVFGRLRHQVSLSEAQLIASEADFRAVQLSIASDIASLYVRLQSLASQIDIAQRSIRIQEENLKLVKGFLDVGRSNSFDFQRTQAQYQLVKARLPSLEQQFYAALNRLSILTTMEVNSIRESVRFNGRLPTIPPSISVGSVENMLTNRPDVIRAEQRLKGAIAEYNINVSDLYPRFSITGSFGYLSNEWSKLGKSTSETFRFTPSIRWAALVDIGRVKSQISAADARAQASLSEFEKIVLTALRETDSAIFSFAQEEVRRENLHVAAESSAIAARLSRQTYELGRGDLRDVLDAELLRLNAAQQLIESEETIVQKLVSIYKNIGGGVAFDPKTGFGRYAKK